MKFEIVPAHEIPLAKQAVVVNKAFAGYLAGWAEMDAAALARFISAQGADLCYSRFVRQNDGELISFGYINRTAGIPRLAGMATVPAGRRLGAAGHLLETLVDEARHRRDEAIVLEVFEQNQPAVSLYERHRFVRQGRLCGWRYAADLPPPAGESVPVNELRMWQISGSAPAFEYPEIPWQISRYAMAKIPLANVFGVDSAAIVLGDVESQTIRVHGLFCARQEWPLLRKLLRTLVSQNPGKEFFAPAIFPEIFGAEIFEPLGFKREPLNQFLMRRDLR